MTRLKADLHWDLQEIPRGARITSFAADNKEARRRRSTTSLLLPDRRSTRRA